MDVSEYVMPYVAGTSCERRHIVVRGARVQVEFRPVESCSRCRLGASSRARRRPRRRPRRRRGRVCTSHRVPRPASRSRHTPPATRGSLFTSCFTSPSLAAVVADKALGRFLAEAVESGAPDVALAPVAEAVASLDVNGDGFITVDELLKRAAEEGVTLSREQAEEFIQVCDEDMDGLCSVEVRAAWFPQRWFVLPPAGARSPPPARSHSLVRSFVRSTGVSYVSEYCGEWCHLQWVKERPGRPLPLRRLPKRF
jgi:hypothetical protein